MSLMRSRLGSEGEASEASWTLQAAGGWRRPKKPCACRPRCRNLACLDLVEEQPLVLLEDLQIEVEALLESSVLDSVEVEAPCTPLALPPQQEGRAWTRAMAKVLWEQPLPLALPPMAKVLWRATCSSWQSLLPCSSNILGEAVFSAVAEEPEGQALALALPQAALPLPLAGVELEQQALQCALQLEQQAEGQALPLAGVQQLEHC